MSDEKTTGTAADSRPREDACSKLCNTCSYLYRGFSLCEQCKVMNWIYYKSNAKNQGQTPQGENHE